MRLHMFLLIGVAAASSSAAYSAVQDRTPPAKCDLPPPMVCPPAPPNKPHPALSDIDSYIFAVTNAIEKNRSAAVAKERTSPGEADVAEKYARDLETYKGELLEYRSDKFGVSTDTMQATPPSTATPPQP